MEGQPEAKVAMLKEEDAKEVEQRRLEGILHAVLNNHLVCENIASHLSLRDVKSASEATWQFHQAMWGTNRVAQTAVLVINNNNVLDIKSSPKMMKYPWSAVKINVTDPSDILEDLQGLLKSAELVFLDARPWKQEGHPVKDPTAVSLLTTVLSCSPKLSHLQMDIRFLFTNLRQVLSSPAVQETLKKLTRLELLEKTQVQYEFPRAEYAGMDNLPFFADSEDADEESQPFARNFLMLTDLPKSLKTFKLTELFPAYARSKDSVNQAVLRLLRNNTATLEELSLRGRVWKIEELRTLAFPALKALTASLPKMIEEEEDTLSEFLGNQTSLEELTVQSLWLQECLLSSIKEHSSRLTKLDMTFVYFQDMQWGFLDFMTELKDFRLKVVKMCGVEEIGNGVRFLASLPENQLESLSLEGISTRDCGFWRLGGKEPELEIKTEFLQGFRGLRKLRLLDCRDAVDDGLMQWILKKFRCLEELELSECYTLTDAGISGKTTAEWGRNVSLSDLRGLKSLKLLRCPQVTPHGLVSSVKLPLLQSLDYFHPPYKVREYVVLGLVEQNPRLKRLFVNYPGDLEKLKAKIREKNHRVELVVPKPRW